MRTISKIAPLALALATALAACGSDNATTPDPPDLTKFVGTWEVVSGQLDLSCSNMEKATLPVTPSTTFILGTISDLVDANPDCPVRYDVTGTEAHVQQGQRCARSDIVTPMHLIDLTFATTDGASATHSGSGYLSGFIDLSMAWPVNCNWTQTATYQRAAQ